MRALGEIILRGMEQFPDRDAVADPSGGRTYAELGRDVFRLARALRRLGVEAGDRSVIVLPNSIDFVRAHFANLAVGAISVPCDAATTAESLRQVAGSCTPRVLVTDAAGLARFGGRSGLPAEIRHVVVLDASPLGAAGAVDGRAAAEAESAEPFLADRAADDIATLMYTTGTTGRPKGVILSHANILAALRSILGFVRYSENDREVVVLPLSHNFGLGHVYCNLMSGGAVYTENGLARVGRVLKAIESFRATGFPTTPLGIGMLMDQYGPVLAQKGANLRFSVINSAPLPPERAAQLHALLPNLDIMVYYGLTEASRSAFISLTREGPGHYRSVGRPMGHVEVRIEGAPSGGAAPDHAGQVVIRGPAVARGYWNNTDEEAAAFRDGWLQTGDLGRIDERGFLWIIGRIKDVINVGGYKVLPGEVERALGDLPGVVDVGVAGLDGLPGMTGETVVAGLVMAPDATLDESAAQQHCLGRLEKFKVPARFLPIQQVPRTNTGKTRRADLAALLKAELNSAKN
jgi:long-chain acyl-CoA synthetase